MKFLSNLNVKPPCTNVKLPRTSVKPIVAFLGWVQEKVPPSVQPGADLGATIPQVAKSPNIIASSLPTFFNTVICFQKTLVSNMGRQTCFLPQAPSNLGTPRSAAFMKNSHVAPGTRKWTWVPQTTRDTPKRSIESEYEWNWVLFNAVLLVSD